GTSRPYLRIALLLIPGACTQAEPERTRRVASPAAAVQDTAFRGTTVPLHRPPPPRAAARETPGELLRAVRVDPQPGFDRVVFEFAGDGLPGYHVEYATAPVVRCGSGDPVAVAASGRLVVRFEPARAHDQGPNPTLVPRAMAPGLPAVRDLQIVCDFEGQVEMVLGVPAAAPYRVVELTAPVRLVLDVRHGAAP
ncbi:MAG: AMIN-like domain-containing (lipo)protein, partial [Gemmatimonadales bacterium]